MAEKRKLGEAINLPGVVQPQDVQQGKEYVGVLRSSAHEWTFIGPFRPIGELKPMPEKYPYPGNFCIQARFRNGTEEHTLIPKEGRTKIMKHTFSLHLYTPEIKEIMERIKQKKRLMRGEGIGDH